MMNRIFGGKALGVVASLFMLTGANECLAESDANFSLVAAEKGYSVLQFDSIEGIKAQSRIYEKFGMRLSDLEVYEATGGGSSFIGVWEPGTDLYKIEVDNNWSNFENRWSTNSNGSTYRLKDVERVSTGGGGYLYYSLYRQGSGGAAMFAGNWSAFTSYWADASSNNGLRLIDVDVQGQGSSRSYVGTFAPGSDAYVFYGTSSWSDFNTQFNNNRNASLELIDVDIIRNSGTAQSYYGVWRSGGNQGELVTESSYDDFKQDWVDKVDNGYQLIDLDISEGNSSNSFQNFIASYKKVSASNMSSFNPDIDIMGDYLENSFATSSDAEGMSYAISRNGQIARAGARRNALIGIDNPNGSAPVPMTSETHQTLASVTKMVTAPLVHRLLRLRGLDTAAPISDWIPNGWSKGVGFGNGGVSITFKQLLSHTSGLGQSGTIATQWSALMSLVASPPSLTTPNNYSYSNTNYALLRVLIPALRNGLPAHSNSLFQNPIEGSSGVSSSSWSSHLGSYFDYMGYLVADAFSIPTTCDSVSGLVGEAFMYNLNPTSTGLDWSTAIFGGDDCGGHQGLRMSAQELVQYWDRVRYDDTIVTEAERNRMRGGQGMMSGWPSSLRINSTTWHAVGHNGSQTWGDSSGSGAVRTCLVEFPGDITASLLLNSSNGTGLNVCQNLRDGYELGVSGLSSFPAVTLQAEDASMSGANVGSWWSGYTGSGFVDTINSSGNWVEFDVNNIPYSGIYRVAIRYSNGSSANRPLDVSINGVVENSVNNTSTGSWSSWATANVNIPLVKGNNKVRLIGTGSSGAAMIDRIIVSKVAISSPI